MKVSTRAEYGFRALIDLAVQYGNGPVHTHTIAERQGLPEPYLNQLMATLRQAGLVTSKRGPAGGHTLARPPEEITLREAFAVLEGTTAPWWCVEVEQPDCEYVQGCGLRPVWRAIDAAAAGVLDRLTLADLKSKADRPSLAPPSVARPSAARPPAARPPAART
jgi:Rrf2 family protein